MTVVNGALADSPYVYEDTDGIISSNVIAADDYIALDVYEMSAPVIGTVTDNAPTTTLTFASSAERVLSSSGLDTFYYRIVLTPESLDLGNIVAGQSRTVIVWNGFFVDKTVSSASGVGMSGISVALPDVPPYDMPALEEQSFEFTIDASGAPKVNALFTWTIDGDAYVLPITGSRINLWPFPPNWSQPVVEGLEWYTRVGISYDGSEQRASLRHQARRRLSYQFNVLREETQRFDNVTWGWQNRAFAVPIWNYRCELTAPAVAADLSLALDTTTAGFAVDNLAAIYLAPDNYEIVEIDAVADASITLKRPLAGNWEAGAAIYPVSVAYVEGNIAATRLTDSVLAGSVRFLSQPIYVDPFTPDAAAPSTYNGYETLLVQPNWAGGLMADREYPNLRTDTSTGAIEWTPSRETPILLRQYSWMFKTRAEVKAFREFLQRRKGKFKPVYIPTWHPDFSLFDTIHVTDTSMVVKDFLFAAMVGADAAKAHLYFRRKDGQTHLRPITSVAQNDGTATIGFTTALGVEYTVADVQAIHLLMLWRLASDEVQINWLTDEIATVTATFQAVKA